MNNLLILQLLSAARAHRLPTPVSRRTSLRNLLPYSRSDKDEVKLALLRCLEPHKRAALRVRSPRTPVSRCPEAPLLAAIAAAGFPLLPAPGPVGTERVRSQVSASASTRRPPGPRPAAPRPREKGRRAPARPAGRRRPRGPAASRAPSEPSRTSPSRRPNLPEPSRAGAEPPRAAPPRARATDQLGARRESRGAHVEGHGALTMELSEYVQRGFQTLADPGSFDSNAFALLLRAAFQSLLDARADEAALGKRLARRRGLGGGAPGRAASPAPGAQPLHVPGLAPARPACGDPSGPRAPLRPRRAPARGQLHAPGLVFLPVSLFLCKAAFKSCLWPNRVGFAASRRLRLFLTLGLQLGRS